MPATRALLKSQGPTRIKKRKSYQPHKGFIGRHEVDVSNYLFSKKTGLGYTHSKRLSDYLMNVPVNHHYQVSQRVTRFLKKRDLTFQKCGSDGIYRIFTVPVTQTVVPLPKSVFITIEMAAQVLMISLRKVLQSIYGAPSIAESDFVKSLPDRVRDVFLNATVNSPHYISALHHPNMKDYPFLDNVGLDLVLVEDYLEKRGVLTKLLESGRFDEIPDLPFRVLELNAGSPSGASNNFNIMEGLLKECPEVLDALGPVFHNDHFSVLQDTYRTLGSAWTGIQNGVQVILPPGGSNGAAPEIHQLAAYSGLVYCDPGQLFQDAQGFVRLRTVGGLNPVVTAIYSRVNTDSALFDREKGVLLRDPESGEPLYCLDTLKPWKNGKPVTLNDELGNPIPLESEYTIPGAIDAILNRKLYMGGLNRLLDNKIILATLTEYAPLYFEREINRLGLSIDGPRIVPPECLPSSASSLARVERTPDDWVVKAPNLSGGSGVNILMTLDQRKQREVIDAARKNPDQYAYQRVVKIGRIPVAVRGTRGVRFANLAADIRMWVFFGGGENALPKITHNALVRYAPKETGPMSSIVNTSKGGGYAPFAVIDDMSSDESVTAREMATPREPVPFQTELPVFVGSQLVQVANMIHDLRVGISRAPTQDLYRLSGFLYSLKLQLREITSFVHPRCMEVLYSMIELVEKRMDRKGIARYFVRMNAQQARLVSLLQSLDSILPSDLYLVLDEFHVLNQDVVNRGYEYRHKRLDLFNFGHFSYLIRTLMMTHPDRRRDLNRLRSTLKEMISEKFPFQVLHMLLQQRLESLLDQFADLASKRLRSSEFSKSFSEIFLYEPNKSTLFYSETFVVKREGLPPRSATEWEVLNERPLADSEFIEDEIRTARSEWMAVQAQSDLLPKNDRDHFLANARQSHFEKHPKLLYLQSLLNQTHNSDWNSIIALMSVLPYAAYNLRQFAIEQGSNFIDLFSKKLQPNQIALLNRAARLDAKVSEDLFSGECFARKRQIHGLVSESDRFIWVAEEQSPFVQLYTIGHELIHAAQIKEVMSAETRAMSKGQLAFAWFLNHYGNFLSLASNTYDLHEADQSRKRKPLYGLPDRIVTQFDAQVIQDVRRGLTKGGGYYEQQLDHYGSLFGYMMPVSNAVRVKALREVIPALENAKNIMFAKECGLLVSLDEVKAALPTANQVQVARYRTRILEAAKSFRLDHETLRVIASHQYYGVMFSRADDPAENLTIHTDAAPIFLSTAYHQTQQ